MPPETAEQMRALLDKSVRFFNRNGEAVGFLTEEEIEAGKTELREPEAPDAPAGAEAEAKEEPKADGAWMTVKRAPLA